MDLPSPRLYSRQEIEKKIQVEQNDPRPDIKILVKPRGLLYTQVTGEYSLCCEHDDSGPSEGLDVAFEMGQPFIVHVRHDLGFVPFKLTPTSTSEIFTSRAPLAPLHPKDNYELWNDPHTTDIHKKHFRSEHPMQFAAMKAWQYYGAPDVATPQFISDDIHAMRMTNKEKTALRVASGFYDQSLHRPGDNTKQAIRFFCPSSVKRTRLASRPLKARFITNLNGSSI